jgi:hypothetical protein
VTADLAYIIEPLHPLAVPIDSIFEDPANANQHDERSIRAIMSSYARYKQRKPIVVNANDNIVEAGNGQLEAARRLGWSHIAVVFVEDDPTTHAGYAIADNRSAQLAQLDEAALVKLLAQVKAQDPDEPLSAMWTEVEWEALLDAVALDDEEDLDEVDFPAFDEDVAGDVLMMRCPECGHEFPI